MRGKNQVRRLLWPASISEAFIHSVLFRVTNNHTAKPAAARANRTTTTIATIFEPVKKLAGLGSDNRVSDNGAAFGGGNGNGDTGFGLCGGGGGANGGGLYGGGGGACWLIWLPPCLQKQQNYSVR